MSKKYFYTALALILAFAVLAVPASADDAIPGDTVVPPEETVTVPEDGTADPAPSEDAALPEAPAAGRTFTWTDNEPLVIDICADEGFSMPEFFILRINDVEYTVSVAGEGNPEGITYDPEAGKLSIAPSLIKDGDTFALIGSAVGVRINADALTDIDVVSGLGRDYSAAKPLEIAIAPAEGYVLPDELHLVMDDILYTVHTDGKVYTDGVAFEPDSGILTVDPMYLSAGQTVALSGTAVPGDTVKEEPEAPEQEPGEDTEEEPEEPEKDTEQDPAEEPEQGSAEEPGQEPTEEPGQEPTEEPEQGQEPEQDADANLSVAVNVTMLENVVFTEPASQTVLTPTENNMLTLAPGQDLVLGVAPMPGTALPEAFTVAILRADGLVITETFRFDGQGNVPFLTFDPMIQQIHIAASAIHDLDTVIIAPVMTAPAVTPAPTPTPTPVPTEPGAEQPDEPGTEQPSEPGAEQPTEPVTEQPTEPVTEQPTEPVTEQPAAPATEQPAAPAAEQPTSPVTPPQELFKR